MDVARSHPDECPACMGRGQTKKTKTVVDYNPKTKKLTTVELGYGCVRCRGTGRLKPQENQ